MVRVGFNGRIPVPPVVPHRRRVRADPDTVYYGSLEALRVIGCSTGLCGEPVLGPLPDRPDPPMWLERAGAFDYTEQYDHDSLYARVAHDLLVGDVPGVYPARPSEARMVARRVMELLNWKYAPEADRYVIISEPSAYARLYVSGGVNVGHRRCRSWYEWAYGEPPLSFEEAVEVLREAPCRAYAVRVKDFAKFSILSAIGYTKHTTGLWRYVVAWARHVVVESARWLREHGVTVLRGYVDSYQVEGRLGGREPPYWKRYPVKPEGRGPGMVWLAPTYRAGDSYGFWGVWEADGRPPTVPLTGGLSGTVYYVPGPGEWYRNARAVLECRAEPPERVKRLLAEAGERFGVGFRWGRCTVVVDRMPGVVRWWRSEERVVIVLGVGVERRKR